MRISIVRGDPGYDPTHQRRVERVTLDGLPIMAVTADEEQGFADELVMAEGQIALNLNGEPITRRVTGKVVIKLRDDGRRWDKDRRLDGVKVQVGRDRNLDILVQVFSWARPGAIKQGRMHYQELPSGDAAVCQKAGMTAGAMAEMLCEQFGDRLDPSECARVAFEQCHAMLQAERGPRG